MKNTSYGRKILATVEMKNYQWHGYQVGVLLQMCLTLFVYFLLQIGSLDKTWSYITDSDSYREIVLSHS